MFTLTRKYNRYLSLQSSETNLKSLCLVFNRAINSENDSIAKERTDILSLVCKSSHTLQASIFELLLKYDEFILYRI